MDDAASCKEALKDAYGVFLVTNYWEIFDANREIQQVCERAFSSAACAIECCANRICKRSKWLCKRFVSVCIAMQTETNRCMAMIMEGKHDSIKL